MGSLLGSGPFCATLSVCRSAFWALGKQKKREVTWKTRRIAGPTEMESLALSSRSIGLTRQTTRRPHATNHPARWKPRRRGGGRRASASAPPTRSSSSTSSSAGSSLPGPHPTSPTSTSTSPTPPTSQRGRRCRRGTGSGSSSAGRTASTPTARAPAAPRATATGRPRGRIASSAGAAGRWGTRRRSCTTTAGPRAGSARTGSCTSTPCSPTRSLRPRRGGSPTRCTSFSRRAGPGPRTASSTARPFGRRIGWMTMRRE